MRETMRNRVQKMKIINVINGIAMVMLLFAVGGAAIAIWTANRAEYFSERITLAHRSYERHLELSSNTYQLFKQYGDAMLIGDLDEGRGEAELIRRIRGNISDIRSVIGEEIEMVGEEEIEELELLSKIERKIEDLIGKFEVVAGAEAGEELRMNWGQLSAILDDEIDRDFRSMIDEALEEELEEVVETRAMAQAHAVLATRLALAFAILAVVVTLLSLRAYRHQIAGPLAKLMGGVRAFASGQFSRPIGLTGRNEISEVAQVLDDMAEMVEQRTRSLTEENVELEKAVRARTNELERLLQEAQESESTRRQLMADVSHELRTPLTIIQGESEIALRGADKSPDEYRDALIRARDAAAHTTRLVNDLLFISRTESGAARLALEEVDLHALIDETVGMAQTGATLIADLERAPVNVDPVRVRQSVIALLQNARHHGGAQITVRLMSSPLGYRVAVEDDGPGMTDVEKKRAFERFFRGSNAAESYTEGAGLGLPVVRSIAEAHGGHAWLEDRPGGGTVAVIELPKRPRLRAVS